MPPKLEPPKTLKLGQKITVDENYEVKTSSLNLNDSDINNAKTINVKNINVMKDGNIDLNGNVLREVGNAISDTDAVNLGQLNRAMATISINDIQMDKKINDEILRATNAENTITNNLNAEITTRQTKDNEMKSNIDTINLKISDNSNKIEALYKYFFGTMDVDLSKN